MVLAAGQLLARDQVLARSAELVKCVLHRLADCGLLGAGRDLSFAQELGEIKSGVRAEKTTISEALQKAFDKLRAAREQLIRLEKLALARIQ